MLDYRIVFEHIHLSKNFAEIGVDYKGRCATVSFTREFEGVNNETGFDPELHGKHEAIHLFLERLSSLAHSRYVMEREIYDAEEGMVRVLEKLLIVPQDSPQ